VSYIGNNPVNQNFVAGADQFSGTGSQTVFTLSRNVNTVFDMFVTVSNVPQDPFTAYTVAGNTLTFDSAPPSGTNNIDVVYRATNVQTFVPSPGVSQQFSIGTAASPAITFIGDTNTGIFSPGADTLAFVEGGTEVMRLDSSANVGIGTSTPTAKLEVNGAIKGNGVTLSGYDVIGGGTTNYLSLYSNSGGPYIVIRGSTGGSQGIEFGTGGAERARIASNGNLLVATTSSPTQTGAIVANNELFVYNIPTTASGANCTISSGEGNRFYRSTSALKYKQDIRDIESIDIGKFRPVRYKSKCENDDQTKDHFGIIADEVAEEGFEELVTRGADGAIEGFQYDRLTVVLLKTVQEQQQMIETLQAKVAALEAK
jgi:hypothetical protein